MTLDLDDLAGCLDIVETWMEDAPHCLDCEARNIDAAPVDDLCTCERQAARDAIREAVQIVSDERNRLAVAALLRTQPKER